jgi:hypothetical protein
METNESACRCLSEHQLMFMVDDNLLERRSLLAAAGSFTSCLVVHLVEPIRAVAAESPAGASPLSKHRILKLKSITSNDLYTLTF